MSVASSTSPTRHLFPRHTRLSAAVLAGLVVLLAVAVWLVVRGGSAPVVAQTRAVAPFNAVELAGINVVTVHVGGTQSVVVHARKSEVGLITTHVQGSTLVIGNLPFRKGTKGPMSVSVTVPSLTSLAIPSSGSGVIHASGTTPRLDASVAGSGNLVLSQLVARDVHATMSGDGVIDVVATHSLNASVTGNGVIRYSGNPAHVTTSVTGTGVIIPG